MNSDLVELVPFCFITSKLIVNVTKKCTQTSWANALTVINAGIEKMAVSREMTTEIKQACRSNKFKFVSIVFN